MEETIFPSEPTSLALIEQAAVGELHSANRFLVTSATALLTWGSRFDTSVFKGTAVKFLSVGSGWNERCSNQLNLEQYL